MIILLKLINKLRIDFFNWISFQIKSVQWRLNNKNNYTSLGKNISDLNKIKVGKYSYGSINAQSFENPNEKLLIGNFVSIASNVCFILGGNHQIDTFTTFPLKTFFEKLSPLQDATTRGEIVVEDEVWIGTNVIVMSGVTIGKGAIVAAGSVVTKNVSPFSIVGGNPAKFIKWRIPEELIESRMNVNLIDFNIDFIKQNMDTFYKKIDQEVLEKIKSKN
ncbi:CatB-related O-acetyltransferase [Chryseobacterium gambrini]|jgi:acetyltransferase-like isoleucine patch superfamily enzyme|uniref:Transferase hexapeptide (Six repeat-containing protein) n=1 Tax=Chryseobacterium gambrini TaxID=373672 RepID=A0A1N7QNK9_9FLAO|nr:CatB-related O-acetyltransferase [Chryseobacterium gambrini]SIT24396.1 transferase hexapeptide (six repeat-containing protein) [Chryseobacterium gambrini]